MTPAAVAEREEVARMKREPATAPPETPRQKRDRLRATLQSMGIDPFSLDDDSGDCDAQIAAQTRRYETVLANL